jgi:hypothetical protein
VRKNPKKLVLHRETLQNLTGELGAVVGGKLLPPTNMDYICNTIAPCTYNCWTVNCGSTSV